MKQLDGPSIYLDQEQDSDLQRLDDAETFLKSNSDKCVVLDEIEQKPMLFSLLRSSVDLNRRPGRFIILGSASPDLIKGASETLAGSIAYSELSPLALIEVFSQVSLTDHWLKGGFSAYLAAPKPATSFRWLGSFIKTFVFQDLQSLGIGVHAERAKRMMEMLAHLNGSVLNMQIYGCFSAHHKSVSGHSGRLFYDSTLAALSYKCLKETG